MVNFTSELTEFLDWSRQLGLTADNLVLGQGAFGVSVLVEDKSKPVKIHVPDRLLLRKAWIDFETNKVSTTAELPDESLREYFDRFLELTITDEELQQRADLEKAMAEEDLTEWGKSNFGPGLAHFLEQTETQSAGRERLVQARLNQYNGEPSLMPILGLVNHGFSNLTYKRQEGLLMEGPCKTDEVFVRYANFDPVILLNTYGFSIPSPFAYSVSAAVNFKTSPKSKMSTLSVGNRVGFARNDQKLGRIPVVQKNANDRVILTHLLLSQHGSPRLPRAIWDQVRGEIGVPPADSVFEVLYNASCKRTWALYQRALEIKDEGLRDLLASTAREQMRSYGVFM